MGSKLFPPTVVPIASSTSAIETSATDWKKQVLMSLLWLLCAFAFPLYLAIEEPSRIDSVYVQLFCLVAALLLLLVANGYGFLITIQRSFLNLNTVHCAWIFVVAAVFLRLFLVQYLPPAQQLGFEELQTGGNAWAILESGRLPIEFRFTNLLAVGGLWLQGELPEALRRPFIFAGAISIIVMALLLRRLNVRWGVLVVTLSLFSTTRWLVFASGAADELFAGILCEVFLLYCLTGYETSQHNTIGWAGLAGVFAGILMYEYSSFRIMLALASIWVPWRLIRPAPSVPRSTYWLATVCFVCCLVIVAAPTLANMINQPTDNVFLEGFRRHGNERPVRDLYIQQTLGHIRQYSQVLIGQAAGGGGAFYRRPDEGAIPYITGILFGLSVLFGLFSPRRPLMRLLVFTIVLTVLIVSLSTNNNNIGRLTPILPLLIVLVGLWVDSCFTWVLERSKKFSQSQLIFTMTTDNAAQSDPNQPLFTLTGRLLLQWGINLGLIGLVIYVVVGNITSIRAMSKDERVLDEYINQQYLTCRQAGMATHAGQTALIYSLDNVDCRAGDYIWLYDRGVYIQMVSPLPDPATVTPGTVLVIGNRHGIPPADLQAFVGLAYSTNNAASLRITENARQFPAAASFCFGCE